MPGLCVETLDGPHKFLEAWSSQMHIRNNYTVVD